MINNYPKLAFRNNIKHKLLFTISVLGLSVGMAASVFLFVYTQYEKSYDTFYSETDNLYRINFHVSKEGKQIINSCRTHSALNWVLQDESEMVAASARVLYEECYMFTDRVKLFGQHVLWADSSFLNVFQPRMVSGDISTALTNKYSVAISEDVSKKYFGNKDPLGKVIKLNEGMTFTVTGVYESVPKNTHLHYDFVLSFSTLEDYGVRRAGNWRGNYVSTYFRKQPEVTEASITKFLNNISDKYLSARYKNEEQFGYSVMPVRDIYLLSKLEGEYQQQGSATKVKMLFIIAILIMVIAWVNSINISTAMSFERAKETGVLKLFGAGSFSLVKYNLSESFLLNIISVVASLIILILIFPLYTFLVGNEINLGILRQPWLWGIYAIMLLSGSILTGVFTALIHVSVKPLQALGNKVSRNLRFNAVRRILTISQFTMAIALIVATIVIGKQITYLESQNIGMDAQQVLVMRGPATNNTSGDRRYTEFCAFREELMKSPYIENVTATMNIPGEPNRYKNVSVFKDGSKVDASFNTSYADNNYFETYHVPIIAGRNFYPDKNSEKRSIIINEKALYNLGYTDAQQAIGTSVKVGKSTMQIIGVVKNFHHESLQKEIDPYIYRFKHPHEFGYYPALVSTANLEGVNNYALKVWQKHYPDAQADFFFLDQYFNRQYLSFKKLSTLIGISSLLGIALACLGLFAFVVYTINHKIKEIGIRKVNGAKVSEILSMLNKDFIKWVVIAFVIACPIAYYAMSLWLENFAYKTNLSWWIFALAGVLALGIALLTVSWQSWRAATRNPVEALRYE